MARASYSLNSYVGGATAALVSGTITAAATVITISGTSTAWGSLGSTGGWFGALNYGAINEEKIYVPSGLYPWSSGVVTLSGVVRGVDGTTASGFSGVKFVAPVLTATDLQEANFLVNQILGQLTLQQSISVSGYVLVNSGVSNTTAFSGAVLSVGGYLGYSDVNTVGLYVSNVNNYNQVVYQNTSSGNQASASVNVSNNLATSGNYYGEFGINSSTYSGTGSFSLPNAVYIAVASGDLSLGNYFGGNIHFVVSGSTTDAMTISGTGQTLIPNLIITSGTSTTPTTGDNSTNIATTAFVTGIEILTLMGALI